MIVATVRYGTVRHGTVQYGTVLYGNIMGRYQKNKDKVIWVWPILTPPPSFYRIQLIRPNKSCIHVRTGHLKSNIAYGVARSAARS